jgi:hypothetical protein
VVVFASHCLKSLHYSSFSLNRASTLAKVLMVNAAVSSRVSRIRSATSLPWFKNIFKASIVSPWQSRAQRNFQRTAQLPELLQ